MLKDKIIEETSGSWTNAPNMAYSKFFDKFQDIAVLNIKEWKPVHVLAYFCKKYKEHYNIEYKFKFNNPLPSKSFEMFQIKRLGMFLSTDPEILKTYIDWVYKTKVKAAKRRLTSIAFMVHEGVITEYKTSFLFKQPDNANKVYSRATKLPQEYMDILSNVKNYPIETYGDLAMINQMPGKSEDLIKAFASLKEAGLDLELLKKVV